MRRKEKWTKANELLRAHLPVIFNNADAEMDNARKRLAKILAVGIEEIKDALLVQLIAAQCGDRAAGPLQERSMRVSLCPPPCSDTFFSGSEAQG